MKQHLSGKESTVEALRGHVVVINVWAVWCGPCIREIPELLKVVGSYGNRALLLAVYYGSENEHRRAVDRWLEQNPPHFARHIVWGNSELRAKFASRALPTTYVIGRDGEVVERFEGAILSPERIAQFRSAIEKGLARPPFPRPTERARE
jgi:thiol-disulfide isomerase/thioredoxin